MWFFSKIENNCGRNWGFIYVKKQEVKDWVEYDNNF